MKKIYAFVAAIIVLAAASVAVIVNAADSDSFFEANVEALADVENATGKAVCYSQYTVADNSYCLVCVECTYKPGIGSQKGGYCKW